MPARALLDYNVNGEKPPLLQVTRLKIATHMIWSMLYVQNETGIDLGSYLRTGSHTFPSICYYRPRQNSNNNNLYLGNLRRVHAYDAAPQSISFSSIRCVYVIWMWWMNTSLACGWVA